MKKIFLLLAVVAGIGLTSCEGPEGPQGPTGYTAESQVIEITGVNFTAPSFGVFVPYGFDALQTDHALVYRLSGSDNGNYVWQLIPQNYFFADGTFDFGYNYDATYYDANIYLEGQDLITVPESMRLNQIFRIVIVPGQFANKSGTKTDYNSVTQALNITEADFKKASRKYQP